MGGFVGGHAYSRDGINWVYSSTPAYYFEVGIGEYGSKVTFSYHRRERPHLLFDANGDPIYLTNGVGARHVIYIYIVYNILYALTH